MTLGVARWDDNPSPEEMLRRRFAEWEFGDQWTAALDAALAAERRATVERIRDAIRSRYPRAGYPAIDAILDAEAQR